MRTILYNGNVITPFRSFMGGIIVQDSRIEEVFEGSLACSQEKDILIDVKGQYISPGFIDIHTHGGGGYDFMDGTAEAVLGAAHAHMMHGTTSIYPTTLASTWEELNQAVRNYEEALQLPDQGPNLLGLHLEGPYFSMEQRGAQDARYIRNPNPMEYLEALKACKHIRRWTVAPELEGALEMGRELRKRGIVASIGHSDAVYEQVVEAFENGYTHVTHLYSGMSMVKRIHAYRYAGVVESAYLLDNMTVEIIADGKHLPASLLKLIVKIKGPDRICLVTDSMRAAGMTEGESIIGSRKNGQRVIIEDGVAKMPDRTAFAGSIATSDRLVRVMVKSAEVSMVDAVRMMTHSPAKVMGIDNTKGTLAPGKDADIIVFDDDIQVGLVAVMGHIMLNRMA